MERYIKEPAVFLRIIVTSILDLTFSIVTILYVFVLPISSPLHC